MGSLPCKAIEMGQPAQEPDLGRALTEHADRKAAWAQELEDPSVVLTLPVQLFSLSETVSSVIKE